MPDIKVIVKAGKADASEITAWINLGDKNPLADRATLKAHPGWSDVERRTKIGEIGSAYLTASSPQLLVLPAAAAKYHDDREKVKILAAQAFGVAQERKAESLVIVLNGAAGATAAADAAEGIALYAYNFDKYKKPAKTKSKEPKVSLLVTEADRAAAQSAVKDAVRVCEAVNRARDLINEPGSVATPEEIEVRARKMAKAAGLKITVLDAKQLKKEGYEGLLSVGRGGSVDPRMIVLSYIPKGAGKDKTHLGLLGKGITFDTGGVSIKPAGKMWEMKGDMSGAAAVLYGMELIAAFKPKVRVTGIIVTAQNYVDEDSIVPGDIIKARNGKFIHVDNTDAEGRLILTDGLWRMGEEKVTHLADFATLTGAVVRALGTSLSGAFGNDTFVDHVVECAESCGELCWKLPMHEEYVEWLKCDIADINNITGKTDAGATTAALFLKEFIPEGVSWTHMDIAGTFLVNSKWKYFRPGATGVMVRTILALAQSMSAK